MDPQTQKAFNTVDGSTIKNSINNDDINTYDQISSSTWGGYPLIVDGNKFVWVSIDNKPDRSSEKKLYVRKKGLTLDVLNSRALYGLYSEHLYRRELRK